MSTKKTVPKMSLIAPPRAGGAVCTRTFIPHRVHEAIGVLGAVSVATACVLKGSVADGVAKTGGFSGSGSVQLEVEHPTGFFTVDMEVETDGGQAESEALRPAPHRAQADGRARSSCPARIWRGA